nr:S9 family peptidase [Deltaproteobacteria bacterium]
MKTWALFVVVLSSVAFADSQQPQPSKQQPPSNPGYSGHGANSVSEKEIAKYLAPQLPDTVARRIQTMLDVRGAGGGIMTAKGDRMVFNTRITGTSQIWRQDGPMKFAIQLTGGEDRTAAVDITPDDRWIVVSRDVGGQENPGLYLMPIEGGQLKLVQHAPKVQSSLQYVSDDSKWLYFRANDIAEDSYAIYRYDINAGKKELVFDQKGLWSIADRKGDQWLMYKQLGSAQVEIYSYDLKSKQLTPVLGQNELEEYEVQFGAKPGQVLVKTNKPSDFRRVYSFERGKLTPITPELKYDVDEFSIDDARQRIYYRINEGGYSKLAVL